MKLQPKNREELVEAALGKRIFDLVIRNVQLVNVFTGEIYPAEIGIYDGFIAHIHANPDGTHIINKDLEGREVFDGQGQYIMPGFVDPHIHIESTLMTPTNFSKAVLPLGTTTVVTDPHEVANVMGMDAVKYMLETSQHLPMRQYILAPSCVPSLPGFEVSGAEFRSKEISEMLSWDRVLGLAEVMDFPGVISNDKRMTEILAATEQKNGFIQGHAIEVTGRELSAYICGGPVSDHETYNYDGVRERLRSGMYVDAKASTFMDNVSKIIPAAKDLPFFTSNLTLCTDDREPDGLIREGHMNHVINVAIKAGLEPVKAIACATLHGAREIGIVNLGAIAPGYVADLVISPSITTIKPSAVFFNGCLVAQEGKLLVDVPEQKHPIEDINTVSLDFPSKDLFKITAPVENGTVATNVIVQPLGNEIGLTEFEVEELPVVDGLLDISHDEHLKYVAVLNRYEGNNNYAHGIVRNFPTLHGTIAGTVAHDSHHLVIIYSKPEEAVLAAKELIECGGGFVCVKDNHVIEKLELPVFGLMSTLECQEIAEKHEKVTEAAKSLTNDSLLNPLMSLAVISLPVYPWARITDKGLFCLKTAKHVPLFAEQN